MIEFLVILFWCAVALTVGFGLLKVFAVILGANTHEEQYRELEANFGTSQIARRDDRLETLKQIGGPECKDGTYSPRQIALWRQYNALRKTDDILTRRERNMIVEARGYLPDDIADIIEGVER